MLMLSVITFFLSVPEWSHRVSSRILWYEHHLVATENSVYSNIAVIKEREQYTFYANGSPYATIPVPVTQIEELSHFPMLFHERPENVLIIGGGAGGLLQGVLTHAPKEVHYVEQDPLVIESFRRFPTVLTEYELDHEKVRIHFMEGRFFLRNTSGRYDMIFLNLPIPSTLQLNRYYSVEFFDSIAMRLKDRGIFTLHLPGSESFLSEELKELNRTIYFTLKKSFSHVRVLIGDQNIFMASQDETISTLSEEMLIQRFRTRKISSPLVHEWYIKYKMDRLRFGGLEKEIAVSQGRTVNRDSFPRGVFESMLYVNRISAPFMVKALHAINKIPFLFCIISVLIAILVLIIIQKTKGGLLYLDFAILSTGFVSMLISILLIFLFQVYYGYIYHYIGILTSIFMVGSALGAFYVMKRTAANLVIMEICVLALIFLVYAFILFNPEGLISQITIFFVMFMAGLFTAMEYPAVIYIADKAHQARSSIAGRYYALDLLGAFLGAVVTAVVFISTIGINNTLLLAMIIKSGSLFLVCLGRKK
jgi:spermidine synthase